jgi:hypothetical protein
LNTKADLGEVKPIKIVAGLEAEQTNFLLQKLAEVAFFLNSKSN